MSSYFGFIPSAALQSHIETARQKVALGGSESLYPYRDAVAKGVNDELIINALVNLVADLPANDKKDTMLKLANFIKNQSGSLLSSLLNKADNKDVMKSVDFLNKSAHNDAQGHSRIGFVIPDALYAQMQASFAGVQAGDYRNQRDALKTQFRLLTDLCIKHYMEEFNKTLDLGMLKRGLAGTAKGVISTAVHVAIDKLIPALNEEEMKIFTSHYNTLLYSV
jgi:hypothetical protein